MKRYFLIALSFLAIQMLAHAQRDVTGKVSDGRDGSPLSGVSVTIKGTRTGTTTDQNGAFRISVPANGVLVFSNVGFTNVEVTPGNGPVDVTLQVTQSNLQEVIVMTGYSAQNKRSVAGSVAKLKGDDIKLQPLGSFDKALQGKIPGLLSQSQSGQPGSPADVTIRGKGSINGTNTPLYIMDGVQVNAADFSTINPSDIETFNILKDASSTSIYGSRGANGVIVITTKRGAAGKTRVDYDGQYGYSELPTNKLALMNSAQKLQYEFHDRPFYGSNPFGWTPDEVDSLSQLNYHIKDILFRKGTTQQHQVSASGGNEKTRFYISGSIFDQEGIVITTGLKRYTGRVNLENTFGNFRVGLNSTFGYSRQIGTRENDQYIGTPLNAIRWFNPYLNLYDEDGNYQQDFLQGQPNPLQELLENKGNGDELKGVGNVYVEVNIPWIKGLKARTVWGADYTQNETFTYLDRTTDQGSQSSGGNGEVDRTFAKTYRYTGTTSLSYARTSGDHEMNIALYNEIIQGKSEGFGFNGYGLDGPFKNDAGITPGSSTNGYIPLVTGTGTRNGLVSYFIDGSYGYKRKYYINAGGRRDASSRLSSDDRTATFGQVGLAWIVSEEKFLQGATWLNSLKLKASYGSVGSQGIGDFTTRELYVSTVYNGVSGLVLANLPRPLTWERKVIFNTGVEFTMFKGRFGGTVEYYRSLTKDLFLDRQLSRTSGFQSINNNLGSLENKGIEVGLQGDVVRTKDFTWNLNLNYAHNHSELLDQAGQQENISGLFINRVGQAINSIYVVKIAGVDPQTGDQLYYKADGKTTTSVYDPDDRQIIGPSSPPHFGGFGSTMTWKGISLDVLFSYAWGNYIYNNDRLNVENPIYWYSSLALKMLDEWQQPGDITDIPSPFSDFHGETSRYVEKGDYLRLRNVTLSYGLPTTLTDKLHLKSLRFFAQGQNLHVWHNFQGYDPEVVTQILGGAQYPQLKTITFGLNLGL